LQIWNPLWSYGIFAISSRSPRRREKAARGAAFPQSTNPPSSTKRFAVAKPIPVVPPVITAPFPCNLPIMVSSIFADEACRSTRAAACSVRAPQPRSIVLGAARRPRRLTTDDVAQAQVYAFAQHPRVWSRRSSYGLSSRSPPDRTWGDLLLCLIHRRCPPRSTAGPYRSQQHDRALHGRTPMRLSALRRNAGTDPLVRLPLPKNANVNPAARSPCPCRQRKTA
jgi:hypothetical protein